MFRRLRKKNVGAFLVPFGFCVVARLCLGLLGEGCLVPEGEPLVLRGGYMGPRYYGRLLLLLLLWTTIFAINARVRRADIEFHKPTFRLMAT